MTAPRTVGRVEHVDPADRVAARVTGIGVGLLAFMITWLVGARITERAWEQPLAAVIAMSIALVVGAAVAVVAGRRLLRRITTEARPG